MSQAVDEIKIGGIGASRKRVEDDRFIRGKGNYTDDIVLPGMLHMEILRSPLPHARIRSIDTSKAWQIPGVHLVLTGEMMASRNLAWMPTLSYDTQAVLLLEALLQRVQFARRGEALDRLDLPAVRLDRQHRAGLHGPAVHEDRARAAVGGVAAHVRAGQAHAAADQMGQQKPGFDLGDLLLAVDRELDTAHRHRASRGVVAEVVVHHCHVRPPFPPWHRPRHGRG